jgi:hypothetical protein
MVPITLGWNLLSYWNCSLILCKKTTTQINISNFGCGVLSFFCKNSYFFVISVCLSVYLEFALNMMISKVLLRLLLSGLSIFWPSLCISCLGLKYYKKIESEFLFTGWTFNDVVFCHLLPLLLPRQQVAVVRQSSDSHAVIQAVSSGSRWQKDIIDGPLCK